MIYIIFILAVLVNGATDAANSITGVVSGNILSYRKASLLSAVMNFLGLTVFAFLMPGVWENVKSISSGEEKEAVAVLATVVIFAGGSWIFSIPTSESHALMAAMAGVSAAAGQGLDYVRLAYITVGAALSGALGALFSAILVMPVRRLRKDLKCATIIGSAASSFFHGAQDGQKFLALAVATGLMDFNALSVFFVAMLMFAGTLFGGKRIVRKLGEKMTTVEPISAISSDMGSAVALCIITIMGVPASTTHTKICAIAASSATMGLQVNKKELLSIIFGWALTLPCCIILSYFITKSIN